MQRARDRIREITDRERLLLPVEEVVQDVNRFLRGWAGYFRYGNSARPSTRSTSTRSTAWRCSSPSATSATGGIGWRAVNYHRPTGSG